MASIGQSLDSGDPQQQQQETTSQNVTEGTDLTDSQKMQDHIASLGSLIQDKEDIIENLMLRYDLGIISQDPNRQRGNLGPETEELRRKAEALAQTTILDNHELREMVNQLRDENCHLRDEIYELQDQVNNQVLEINQLQKSNERLSKYERENSVETPDLFGDQNPDGTDDESDMFDNVSEEQNNEDTPQPNNEYTDEKREERVNKTRKESIATPDIYDSESENVSSLSVHTRDSSVAPEKVASEPKKYTSEAEQERLRRKAKKVGAAAVKHVKPHRRKESLAEKLLLGPVSDYETETLKESQAKHRRDSSAPIVNVGFEDPAVLLHYEKLKVQDLETELETVYNQILSCIGNVASYM